MYGIAFAATRHDRQNLQNNSLPALSGHWSIHLPKLPARLKDLGFDMQSC